MSKPFITPTIATLVYCVDDDRILLAKRKAAPFIGHWVAPGGKLEVGESPYSCAERELFEETNLRAEKLTLRGVVTETAPRIDYQWLIFVYVTTEFSGVLTTEEREGELRWWKRNELSSLLLPEADRIFTDRVLDLRQPVFECTFRYNSALAMTDRDEHGRRDARDGTASKR